MTDREPHAPPTPRPLAAPDPHHARNGSLMTATLAPRPTAATAAHPARDGPAGRPWLARLLAGELALPPIVPAPSPVARPPAEASAAARAAACPDLFVVHADPAAGACAIRDLAAATADRVLVLSPDPAAADRLVEQLLKAGTSVLRALAADENPVRPSAAVSAVTSAALGLGRAAQARHEAATELAAAEARLGAFAGVSKVIARLTEVTDSLPALEAAAAELSARRGRLEPDLEAETDTPFARARAERDAAHGAEAARRAAERQAAAAALGEKQQALDQARYALAEAARKPGFLSRLFTAKPKPGVPEPADLEKQAHALEAEVAALAAHARELEAQAGAATAAHATAAAAAAAAELAARRAALEAALAAAEGDLGRARAEAAALNKVIASAVPGEDYPTAVRKLAAAREKVEAARAAVAPSARVVVGTPGSLTADPALDPPPEPFGLLILDRAEELSESELPHLSRLAARCVLVGHAPPADDLRPGPAAAGRRRGPDVPFVSRLARALDRETWTAEGPRLVCRLVHLSPDQRRQLIREPLADRPEVELRFTPAEAGSEAAEIAFPWNVPVAGAKRFLFETLGVVLLRPWGEVAWADADGAIAATWPAADGPGEWLDLEPGVREKVVGGGPFAFTAAVSFDPAQGWDAARAAEWLSAHLPPLSASRFAALPRGAARA